MNRRCEGDVKAEGVCAISSPSCLLPSPIFCLIPLSPPILSRFPLSPFQQAHSRLWGLAAWQVLLQHVVPGLLRPLDGASVGSFIVRAGEAFPGLCDQLGVMPPELRGDLLGQLVAACLEWFIQVGGWVGG